MSPKIPKTMNLIIANIDTAAVRVLDEWCTFMGFAGRRAGLIYLARAMRDNRLLIMDNVTRDCLVGAAKATVLEAAREEARHTAKVVLYEQGFISDPGAVVEHLKRARPDT